MLEEILKKHCPSMDTLFLDNKGREFRQRVFNAMEEYAKEKININKCTKYNEMLIMLKRIYTGNHSLYPEIHKEIKKLIQDAESEL